MIRAMWQRLRAGVGFLNRNDGNLRHKTLRSSVWVIAGNATSGILQLVRSIILARLLTPDIFGLMGICMVAVRSIHIITETGFGAALIQRQTDVEEARNTVFTLSVIRSSLLALVAVLMSPFIASFYEHEVLQGAISTLALAVLLGGFANTNNVLNQKYLNFRPLFIVNQVTALVDFVAVVALAYFWRNVWALVVGQVIMTLVQTVISYTVLGGKPRFGWNPRVAKELFHYGKFITGLSIVGFMTAEIDNVVIGKLLGMEALGIYALAFILANLPATHLSKAVSRVLFPAYSQLQSDRARLRAAYLKTLKPVVALVIPASVGMSVLAHEIIGVVYGEKWILAASVLPILCVLGGFRAFTAFNGYVYNAIGKPKISFYGNLFKLIAIGAVIVPAIKMYGIVGAAMAVTVPAILQYLADLGIFTRVMDLRLKEILSVMWAPIAIATAMGVALWFLKSYVGGVSVLELILLVVAGMIVYGLVGFPYLKRLSTESFGWPRARQARPENTAS